MSEIGSASFNNTVNALVANGTTWYADVNASFVLTSGYLVFMMQLGFLLLTVGAVRARSVRSVCLKNVMDVAAGGVGYFLFGWAFAYGDPQTCDDAGICTTTGNGFIGSRMFALSDIPEASYHVWYFQFVFAISTATIVSGAVAERVKFIAYGLYALFLTIWVYPVLSHWVWSPAGWASTTRQNGPLLLGSGAYDTVGSGAVHMCGGVAGLAGAWMAGPRLGRFTRDGKPRTIPGHNAVFYVTGVILLWFGFFGFNPGTMGAIVEVGESFSAVVARCAISTALGGAFGGCTGLLVYLAYSKLWLREGVWDLCAASNGALTGMVVITSGCATYEPWAAALGGIVGGCIVLPGSLFVSHVMKVDDPVDAFTVHGMGGAAGVWWYSLMAKQAFVYELYGATNPDGVTPRHYGWWQGDDATILGANTIWILCIAGWTGGMMFPFFYLLKRLGLLRVSEKEELAGVDVSKHGGHAYPGMEDLYGVVDRNDLEANAVAIQTAGGTDDGFDAKMNGIDMRDSLHGRVRALETELANLTSRLASQETPR
ncbi:hypothetical protein WJX84_011279 [Apatococcus fuscideae]|uniref:Ammonium transporter AmtB-like domain-containing protein n=1 Tax=Apatococcus fuscideae TaxID=2026836 RepID=A0AAW1SRK2_9CHLO